MILSMAVVALLISYFIFRIKTWRPEPWPSEGLKPKLFQCHRGYWVTGVRENTLAAFRKAHDEGFEMVEMDVRLSGDLVPIVFHDEDLVRSGGLPNRVLDCSAEELLQWVEAPSLEQVLLDKNIPQFLNIELKTNAIFDSLLEKKVSELILKHNASDRVMFSSFNPFSLLKLSRYIPQVPRALLATEEREPQNSIYLRRLWLAPFVKVHALHLDANFVNEEKLKYWSRRGVPVGLWTVNNLEQAKALVEAGALSIISDSIHSTK